MNWPGLTPLSTGNAPDDSARDSAFDDLTRALAARLDRRQFFRLGARAAYASLICRVTGSALGLGLFGTSCSRPGPPPVCPSANPLGCDPNQGNNFGGTCVDYVAHLRNCGTMDRHGCFRGGRTGHTDRPLSREVQLGNVRDAPECQYEGPSTVPHVCVVQQYTIRMSVDPRVTIARWSPQPGTAECRDEYVRYFGTVDAHENEHVRIARQAVDTWNVSHANFVFETDCRQGCAANEDESRARGLAIGNAATEANRFADEEMARLRDQIDTAQRGFDLTDTEYSDARDFIQCGHCPTPCGATTGDCNETWQRCCGGECVDTQVDARHCGDCNMPCAPPSVCSNGKCIGPCSTCSAGQACCDERCVDVASDPQNCGRCGRVCSSGQHCASGSCTCPAGFFLVGTGRCSICCANGEREGVSFVPPRHLVGCCPADRPSPCLGPNFTLRCCADGERCPDQCGAPVRQLVIEGAC